MRWIKRSCDRAARLSAIGGIDLDPEPMTGADIPTMFLLRDPDGNTVTVVEAPAG